MTNLSVISRGANFRNARGFGLSEAAATMALMLPVLIFVLMVIMEVSQACIISAQMTAGASMAAQALAVYYHNDPEVATTASEQQAIFTNIRIPSYINSNSQFQITNWNLSGSVNTVTVTCTYLSGEGSPPLPNFPSFNPLKLGSLFTITSTATYRLQ